MTFDVGLILQVIACGTTLAATWLIGNKHVSGPALSVLAALGFAAVNAWADLWLCAVFSLTMGGLNARNFIRWRRERLGYTDALGNNYRGAELVKRRCDTKNDPVTGICRICGGECGQC